MVRTTKQRLLDNDYDDVVYFVNFDYDTALIGVSDTNRAIYDYNKMVEWLIVNENMAIEEAVEWLDFNTLRCLNAEGNSPIIMFPLD